MHAHRNNWLKFASTALHDLEPFPEGADEPLDGFGPVWTFVMTETQDLYVSDICHILDKNVDKLTYLANLRDSMGRRAVDLATPKYKTALMERSFLFRRYELRDGPAEHVSATCIVRLARDHADKGRHVALKFIRNRDHYQRELSIRTHGDLDNDYVLGALRYHDGDEDDVFAAEAEKKGFYRYLLVMPAAERNLGAVLAHEHIAGRDWDQLKLISKQIIAAAGHMHGKGFVHGDIKPLNIMRIEGGFRLIDLDASVNYFQKAFVGAKYSSSYLPPEMLSMSDSTENMIAIRSYQTDKDTNEPITDGLPYSLLLAHPSFDMWSLGVTLFQLYTGETLFLADDEGNIDDKQLRLLYLWTDDFKQERLKKVKDAVARNLLGRLLMKDPKKRPDASRALSHPFLSGKKAGRLVGEEPEFDVFLSYRVNSDSDHVGYLYNILTAKGLKVWWDRKCLKPGLKWEEGFCDGLVKCRSFVPLLSRNAINHPSVPRQNFSTFQIDSPVCNVLLEYRLALELSSFGMLDAIYPVMIGDKEGGDGVDPASAKYNSYGKGGCHPNAPDITVASVESKLAEHLEHQGLGAPACNDTTVRGTLSVLTAHQGGFIFGNGSEAFENVANNIVAMVSELKGKQGITIPTSRPNSSRGVRAALSARDDQLDLLRSQINVLRSGITKTRAVVREAVPTFQNKQVNEYDILLTFLTIILCF